MLLGAQGLGFSVTTRGFLDDGYCPIYVKSIFSEGAAVEDGRLKPGDVLLEVVFFSSAFHFLMKLNASNNMRPSSCLKSFAAAFQLEA